jgi:dihydrofolate reductase
MRKLVSSMVTSLDGFIADGEGGLDWFPMDDELMRFGNDYFATLDGIVFGRMIYEGFTEFWDHLDPAGPPVTEEDLRFAEIFRGMTRTVVSRTLDQVEGDAVLVHDPEAIADIKGQPGDDLLLICGPELRSALARLGLVDRFRVFVAPVVLGSGLPLFATAEAPIALRLESTRAFGNGVVMMEHSPA